MASNTGRTTFGSQGPYPIPSARRVVLAPCNHVPIQPPENQQSHGSYPPLPLSTRASSEHTMGSSLQDLLDLEPNTEIQVSDENAEAPNVPLPPPSPSTDSLQDLNQLNQRVEYGPMPYIDRVEKMAQYLPHLKCVTSRPRNNLGGGFKWYDYVGSDIPRQGPFISNLTYGLTVEERYQLRARLKDGIPPDVDTRLIVVHDLSAAVIDFLGSIFDVSPECFAEHLNNSGYKDGSYNDPDPSSWITEGMRKDYVSVSWLRPVLRNYSTPSLAQARQLLDPKYNGLMWTEKKVVEQGKEVYPLELHHSQDAIPNIFRREFPLRIFGEAWQYGTSSWREKATIWFGVVATCRIIIVLTDPIPQAMEHVVGPERHKNFAFSIEGSLSPVTQARKGDALPTRMAETPSTTLYNTDFTRRSLFFDQIRPRIPVRSNYKSLMMGYNIGAQFISPTCNDIFVSLNFMNRPQWVNNGHLIFSHNSPISMVLFQIMESDTLQILRLIRSNLREIDHGTMDDILLQQNLQAWRNLITNVRDILPEIRDSFRSFLSFTRDPYGFRYPQLQEASQLSNSLRELELNISDTLSLAVETQKSLFTNISIVDSKRGIAESEAVTRLTELAFVFIPMTFAASLFSMQVPLVTANASLKAFLGIAFGLLGFVYSLRLTIRSRAIAQLNGKISYESRAYTNFTGSQALPALQFLIWMWARCYRGAVALLFFIGALSTALVFLWHSQSDTAYKAVFTVYIIAAFGTLAVAIVMKEEVREVLNVVSTEQFLAERNQRLGHLTLLQRTQSYVARNRLWRLIRGRGIVTGYSLVVVIAPVFALWAQDLDVGLKVGVTIAMLLVVFVRFSFVGHSSRLRRDDDEQ